MSRPAKISSLPREDNTLGIQDTSGQDVLREPSHNRRRRLGTMLVVAVVLAAAIAWLFPTVKAWMESGRAVSTARLRIATVERAPFVRDISAQGTIVAAVSPNVYATDAGTVTFTIKAGDMVNENAIVARIDSPQLTSELAQEQATLDSLTTNLKRAEIEHKKLELADTQRVDLARVRLVAGERELRRAESSWERKVISLQDFEKARDDVETARLEHEHAKRAAGLEKESRDFELQTQRLERDRQELMVANLSRRLAALEVRAPVSGMVGTLNVDQKSAVTANTALLMIVDLSEFEVELRIPETYSDDLALGQRAVISFGGNEFPGILSAVSPEVQNNTVSGRVRFEGEMPNGLRQNQRVSARVLLEAKDEALLVRRGPFLDSGAGRVVYVVEGQRALRTPVEVGAISVNQVELLSGVAAGDRIVISDLGVFESEQVVLLSD